MTFRSRIWIDPDGELPDGFPELHMQYGRFYYWSDSKKGTDRELMTIMGIDYKRLRREIGRKFKILQKRLAW